MATERNKVAKKVIPVDNSGNVTGTLKFNFTDGNVVEFDLAKVSDAIKTRLAYHGAGQKIGDSFSSAKGDVAEAIENATAIVEMLYGGEWSAERESAGPRPSLVADAVIAAKRAGGLPVDEEAIKAKYLGKDGAAHRKTALDNKQVKAEYERLKLEAQQARAKEAADAAASAGGAPATAIADL